MNTLNTIALVFGYFVMICACIRCVACALVDTAAAIVRASRLLSDRVALVAYAEALHKKELEPK